MELACGEGLVIRELKPEDRDDLYALMSHPKVMDYLPDCFDSVEEMAEVISWLRSNYGKPDYIRLTYALEKDGRLLGWLSLGPLPSDEGKRELAYALHPDYWGLGFMSRATKAFLTSAQAVRDAGELWAEVESRNLASVRILEGSGFQPAGSAMSDGREKSLYRRPRMD